MIYTIISGRVIGRNLKKTRLSLGLTQEKAAELMNLSTLHYGRIERGERFPSLTQLALFAEIFDTSIDTLLSGSSSRLLSASPKKREHLGDVINFLAAGCSEQAKALMIDVCQLVASRDKHIRL